MNTEQSVHVNGTVKTFQRKEKMLYMVYGQTLYGKERACDSNIFSSMFSKTISSYKGCVFCQNHSFLKDTPVAETLTSVD